MNVIDSEIGALKEYLLDEKKDISEIELWNTETSEQTSAWCDYEQCRHMTHLIMHYDFESVRELKTYLKELWETDLFFDDYFINRLSVSIFRQRQFI